MQKTYFEFLLKSTLKKVVPWITGILVWFLIFLFIILIPLIFNKDPLFLWTGAETTQIFLCIVIAIMVSTEAVIIFRDGKEDGTDLLILSKPIARWKVIFVKFMVFTIINIVVTIACAITALFTLCFPTMDANLVGPLVAAIIVGNVINILVFGSIAILLSMVFGKVATIAATIGISLLVTSSTMIISLISPSPEKILYDTYDTSVDSTYYVAENGQSYPACWLWKPEEYKNISSKQLWEEANEKSGMQTAQYFDVGKQLILPYKSFGLQKYSLDDSNIGSFAAYSSYRYVMEDQIFASSEIPFYAFSFSIKSEIVEVNAVTIFHDMYGFTPQDAVGKISNNSIKSKYFNVSDLKVNEEQKESIEGFYYDIFGKILDKNTTDTNNIVPFEVIGIDDFEKNLWDFLNNVKNKALFDFPKDGTDEQKRNWNNSTTVKILFEMFQISSNLQKETIAKATGETESNWTDQSILKIINDETGEDEDNPCNTLRITNYMIKEYTHCVGFDLEGNKDSSVYLDILVDTEQRLTWDNFKEFYGYGAYEYLSADIVVSVWAAISLIIYTLAIIVYAKTDFK